MTRFGVLTDSHGLENLEVIARSMSTQGIDSAIHLGDMAYQTMSENTASEAFAAQRKLGALVTATPIQAAALSGEFSDKQLLDVIETNKTARQVSDKITIANYQELDSIFTKNGVTLDAVLGGNWDRDGLDGKDDIKPMSEVFGNRFMNGEVKTLKGHKILGLSGSGSQPRTAVADGLMADNQLRGTKGFTKWREPLLNNDNLDMIISHVPFTSGKNKEEENGIEYLKQFFKSRREERGLKHPKVFMSGHIHRSTSVEYNEELDVLWVQPGVSALNHNSGQHGSFVIMNTNDDTKEVESVEEYRVFNLDNGTQEVEHYGTHFVDLTKEKNEDKVRFERVGTMVVEDHVKKHEDFLQLDVNYKAIQKGISTDYSSAKTAKEKEQRLKNNLALVAKAKEHGSDLVRIVVNTERRYLSKKLGKKRLTNTILEESRDRVFRQLSEYAAQSFGDVDYKKLVKEGASEEGARNATLFFAYGINREDINKALSVGQATEVEKLSHSWGAVLAHEAAQHIENKLREGVILSFSGKEFQEIIELHTAGNLERVDDIKDVTKGFQLWSEMNEKYGGLMTSDYGAQTGLYKVKDGSDLKERTEKELFDLLGMSELMKQNIKSTEEAQKTQEKAMEEQKKYQEKVQEAQEVAQKREANKGLQDAIDSEIVKIYRSKDGNDFLYQRGRGTEIKGLDKKALEYTPHSLEDSIKDGSLEKVVDNGEDLYFTKDDKKRYTEEIISGEIYSSKDGKEFYFSTDPRTGQGTKKEIPDFVKSSKDYVSLSIQEALNQGKLTMAQVGRNDYLLVDQKRNAQTSINPFAEGINPVEYFNRSTQDLHDN